MAEPAPSLPLLGSWRDYDALVAEMQAGPDDERKEHLRWLARNDLFFLIRYVLARKDFDHDWLFQRCREVQASPDGHLDLWARDHRKSTIITFGLTIQNILNDPEITVCFLSFNRPTAKSFLRQIKSEMEENQLLKSLFPEILYADPKKESLKWSEDDGLRVKRKGNPKEETLEAYGLVDGQPTGKHYTLIVYDDVVTETSIGTPEMIAKTTKGWELSQSLQSSGRCKVRYIGTRYHIFDTWSVMIERGAAKERLYPAEVDGIPVLFTMEFLEKRKTDQGPSTYSSQMLLNPIAEGQQVFRPEWVRYTDEDRKKIAKRSNLCIVVDPAGAKKKNSDFTVMRVWAWTPAREHVLIDSSRKRLSLSERTNELFRLYRKWETYGRIKVGYEKYGKDSDIEHIQEKQRDGKLHFLITALGGRVSKEDRIRKLEPLYAAGRVCLHKDLAAENRQFTQEELFVFPSCRHDDILDCDARQLETDLAMGYPRRSAEETEDKSGYREKDDEGSGTWMSQ